MERDTLARGGALRAHAPTPGAQGLGGGGQCARLGEGAAGGGDGRHQVEGGGADGPARGGPHLRRHHRNGSPGGRAAGQVWGTIIHVSRAGAAKK
eukprot:3352149-Pyramimonas_sp.AAC.1